MKKFKSLLMMAALVATAAPIHAIDKDDNDVDTLDFTLPSSGKIPNSTNNNPKRASWIKRNWPSVAIGGAAGVSLIALIAMAAMRSSNDKGGSSTVLKKKRTKARGSGKPSGPLRTGRSKPGAQGKNKDGKPKAGAPGEPNNNGGDAPATQPLQATPKKAPDAVPLIGLPLADTAKPMADDAKPMANPADLKGSPTSTPALSVVDEEEEAESDGAESTVVEEGEESVVTEYAVAPNQPQFYLLDANYQFESTATKADGNQPVTILKKNGEKVVAKYVIPAETMWQLSTDRKILYVDGPLKEGAVPKKGNGFGRKAFGDLFIIFNKETNSATQKEIYETMTTGKAHKFRVSRSLAKVRNEYEKASGKKKPNAEKVKALWEELNKMERAALWMCVKMRDLPAANTWTTRPKLDAATPYDASRPATNVNKVGPAKRRGAVTDAPVV